MNTLRYIILRHKKALLPLVAAAAAIAFTLYGVNGAAESSSRGQYEMTLRALRRAADDCYAIEGQYPPNLDYLCDNYRVRVDTDKYLVIYEVYAPGLRPTIMLFDRSSPRYD